MPGTEGSTIVDPREVVRLIYPENRGRFDRLSAADQAAFLAEERQRAIDVNTFNEAEAQRPCCWCGNKYCLAKDECAF